MNIVGINVKRELSYYNPSAGNPYNDFDLCETYQYDEETKKFNFESDASEMTLIEIDKEKEELKLIVDGKEKTYTKKEN